MQNTKNNKKYRSQSDVVPKSLEQWTLTAWKVRNALWKGGLRLTWGAGITGRTLVKGSESGDQTREIRYEKDGES